MRRANIYRGTQTAVRALHDVVEALDDIRCGLDVPPLSADSIALSAGVCSGALFKSIAETVCSYDRYTRLSSTGHGPSHCAAITGNVSVLSYLCRQDHACIDAKDANGRTPLRCAVTQMVCKAYKTTPRADEGMLSIIGSDSSKGDEAVLNFYQDTLDNLGFSLMDAARVLVWSGAKLDAVAEDGRTPFEVIMVLAHASGRLDRGQTEWLTMVFENVPLRLSDRNGMTPLMHAASLGLYDGVVCLLRRGADAGAVSKNAMTALHYAAKSASQSIINCLKPVSCLSRADKEWRRPVDLARLSMRPRSVIESLSP